MEKFIFWTGIVCIVIVATMIVLLIIAWIRALTSRISQKVRLKAHIAKSKQIGRSLRDAADWFSTQPEVYNVLKIIGTDLLNNHTFNISQVRNAARKAGKERVKL